MRGADLNVFHLDYDMTWAALFTNSTQEATLRFNETKV
jgi:hypothetical protein